VIDDGPLHLVALGDSPRVSLRVLSFNAGINTVSGPFVVLEFPDPEAYARGLASTGPSYEAMEEVGEEQFLAMLAGHAATYVRDGLPLRGLIQLFCYVGTKR